MIKGNRYAKNGSIVGPVAIKVTRIGDHIYLTLKGQENYGIEVPVDDWLKLITPVHKTPIGFSPIKRMWRINDLGDNSISVGE